MEQAGSAQQQARTEIATARAALMDENRPDAVRRQHRRAEMTARERIAALCDDGTFVESGALVRDPDGDHARTPADGVVTGTGQIDGRWVVIASQDFTVHGGSSGVLGSQKMQRATKLAKRDGLPLIFLLDGSGHRIQDGQDSRHFAHASGMFHDMARISGWVPVISAMMGAGFAGPTNYAGMSDFVIMVRDQSYMGMAGPELVKAGTGEEIDKQDLGGAHVQVDQHGLADLGVANEAEALQAIRTYLSFLPSNAGLQPPVQPARAPDAKAAARLPHLIPDESRKFYDVRKVIAGLADQDSVFELMPTYAANAVTAMARLDGRPVGFIANQAMRMAGTLNSPACEKIAHFVAICDAFGLPLIYLVDVPGFLIGSGAERSLLGRRSAKLVFELGHATVPRISVVLRKGYGLGYYGMCGGRSFDADASLAWPSAEICAMSLYGAANVAYRKQILAAEDPDAERDAVVQQMRDNISPLRAAEGYGIDDVIEPDETRDYLIRVLDRAPARRDNQMPPKFRAISPF